MGSGDRVFKRILLKLSGEALLGEELFGIDAKVLNVLVAQIKEIVALGVEVGIVIGGGNLFRGKKLSTTGLNRITGDHMGMLATVMNALALRDSLEDSGCSSCIMSAISMTGLVEPMNRRNAMVALRNKQVVIFAAGTGNPLVTTDTAASLRALEVEADILLKGTQVDGVYSADPALDPTAELFHTLSYDEVIKNQYAVMDLAAFCQCRDYNMPICVFNIQKQGVLKRIVLGEKEGTLIE